MSNRQTYQRLLIAMASLVAIFCAAGCGTSNGANVPASTPASVLDKSSLAGGESACTSLGGTVATDQICHVRSATATYTLDFSFPVDYPDQQALTEFLKRRRDEFVDWVAQQPARVRSFPYELNIVGKTYHSGFGTQSLVLDVGADIGVHPVTTFKTFNYDVTKQSPLTFDKLFKRGSNPLQVLNPIVQRELDKHASAMPSAASRLGVDAYQNFASTDDAVIFFFDQDELLPHEEGPFEVTVTRTELGSILA
jgi:hypothetical protein